MMRLFVALSLSPELRANLASLLDEFKRADPKPRWIIPENLHVTLKFIGHVGLDKLPEIESALAAIRAPQSFAVKFSGIGFFPDERRPAVIWTGMAAPPELKRLAHEIDAAMGSCGIPLDTRPLQPHLTLARLKETPLNAALGTLAQRNKDLVFGTLWVNQFDLVESKLKSSGAEYTTLRSFPLAIEGTNQ